jgi:YD repeat-containing protein
MGGNLLTTVNPAGQTTTDTYDAVNELTGVSYSDGTTPNVTNFTYNPRGQMTGMTDGTGT